VINAVYVCAFMSQYAGTCFPTMITIAVDTVVDASLFEFSV